MLLNIRTISPGAARNRGFGTAGVQDRPANGGATQLFAIGKYHDTVSPEGKRPKLLARHVKLDTRDLGWGHHIPF